MNKLLFALLLIISISNRLTAQDLKAGSAASSKNHLTPGASPAVNGFKTQSSSSSLSGTSPNRASVAPQNAEAGNHTKEIHAGSSGNNFTVSEIMKTDYAGMPAEVKSKINNNKNQGNNLLDGVAKGFTVEIKACKNDAEQRKMLSFLHESKGFINSEFVSQGLVKIIVEPSFDSPELKSLLSAQGLEFNFLNRFYLLKR